MFKMNTRMHKVVYSAVFFTLAISPILSFSQQPLGELNSKIISLKYISPSDLVNELATQKYLDEENKIIINNNDAKLTINNATNQIMLSGNSIAIDNALHLIEFFDVPPRQIIIEAKIIEVDDNKLSALGMDWQGILDRIVINPVQIYINKERYKTDGIEHENDVTHIAGSAGGAFEIGEVMKILQEKGAGRIINIPKIVTINNKKGTILDGYRINYVNKAAGYANIYETQEMTAGLSLAVTPSLGESGYLKMDINAKLTTLAEVVGGSPSELGQIIDNTVIVKDGEEFLLGGFKKTETTKYKRKVPILGTILPFLFSRTKKEEITKDFLIILKPMVIDLTPPAIPEIK